jgi:serine/threonine protein kinase/predicted ATPase
VREFGVARAYPVGMLPNGGDRLDRDDADLTADSWALDSLRGVDRLIDRERHRPPAPERPIPAPIGDRYVFERFLGAGGMGEVWLGMQRRPRRPVALKVVRPDVARDPDWRARLLHEAETLANLDHPGIATVHESIEEPDRTLFVMKYLEGTTLAGHLSRRRPTLEVAVSIARCIAEVLDYAHRRPQPIVHRDLKPANVMITSEGGVVVLDWGIAAVVHPRSQRDPSETPPPAPLLAGTPPYMAPEQLEGRADRSVDIWAFGCVLFECLTDEPLFLPRPTSLRARIDAVLHREPNWPALRSVPAHLADLVRHCLERSPSARLRDIADARPALVAHRAGRRIGSRFDSRFDNRFESPFDKRIDNSGGAAGNAAPGDSIVESADASLEYDRAPRQPLPSNLRSAPPSPVERREERAAILALLDEEGIVAITGPAGCGKSWLALRSAHDAVASRPGMAALSVDCATLDRPEHLEDAVRSLLSGDAHRAGESLRGCVRGRPILLLIDHADVTDQSNGVSVLSDRAAALVAELRAVGVRIILTARRAPTDCAEFRVPRLALPLASDRDPSRIAACDSVRLFTSRATLARPAFRLDRSNAPIVADICRATDGLPALLLRWAGQIAILPPAAIRDAQRSAESGSASRADERLLAVARRDFDALEPTERELLVRVAVFQGPWSLDEATRVVGPIEIDDSHGAASGVAERVVMLCQRSLLEFDDQGGAVRFHTPEPLRQHCRRLLHARRGDPVTAAPWRALHARFVETIAERITAPTRRRDAGTPLDGAALERWADAIALDHENCRHAVSVARAIGDPDTAADLVIALQDFWYPRSLYAEALEAVEPIIAARHGARDLRQMRLHAVAFKMTWIKDHKRARDHAYAALALARGLVPPDDAPSAERAGPLRRLALVLNNVGLIEKELRAIEAAEAALNEAIDIARALNDGRIEDEFRLTLGLCAMERGALEPSARFDQTHHRGHREHRGGTERARSVF